MKITKEKLIEELNKGLEWEYAAAVKYVQHGAAISAQQFDSLSKELIIHAQEEMQHADMVAEHIAFLGGVPTVDIEKRDTGGFDVQVQQGPFYWCSRF